MPDRACRLPRFIQGPPDAGARLDGLRVAVVGCGSVGQVAAYHLARLQIGRLLLVDPRRLKAESVLTHPVLPASTAKREAKALHTARRCKQISPETEILAFVGTVEALPLAALAGVDLVVLASDNLKAEVAVGQRCLYLRRPLLHASVDGQTLAVQVRTFRNADAAGACPACGLGPAEWKHMNEQTAFSCDGVTGGGRGDRSAGPSTVCLSSVCSLAGDLAALQVVRQALGLGESLQDRIIEYYAYANEMLVSPLKAAGPACPCDHETVIRTAVVAGPLGESSLRDLTQAAGFRGAPDDAGVAYAVDDLEFVSLGQCTCGRTVAVRQFVAPTASAGRCPACGRAVTPQPFFTQDPVPAAAVKGLLDRRLKRLGARAPTGILVRGQGRGVLFHNRLRRKAIR